MMPRGFGGAGKPQAPWEGWHRLVARMWGVLAPAVVDHASGGRMTCACTLGEGMAGWTCAWDRSPVPPRGLGGCKSLGGHVVFEPRHGPEHLEPTPRTWRRWLEACER